MTGEPELEFAGLLRELRVAAQLTQEELAEAAGLSSRTVSALERGVNRTTHKETARLLADALHLTGPDGRGSRRSPEAVTLARPALAPLPRPPGRCRGTSPRSPGGSRNSSSWRRPRRVLAV